MLGERHHPGDRLGADVGAARHLRAHRLVVGVGEQTVRPVFHQKVGVPFARLGGLRRVERRRQILRRRLEHAAARAHQVGNPVPVMQLVGGEGRHAVLAVRRVADLDQLVERRGHRKPRLLDQVVARRGLDHGAAFPGEGEGLALGVLHRRLRAGHEILRRPVGRRVLGILGEGVEAGEPAGADPAPGIDEGGVDHVERRALGRQFEVGPLVVDREGLHAEIDLDAGLLLELREVVPEVFEEGRLEARGVDRRAGEGLALGDDGGSRKHAGCKGRQTYATPQHRPTIGSAHAHLLQPAFLLPELNVPAMLGQVRPML